MDFAAIDEVFRKLNQPRPDSSIGLFKLIRKRDWAGDDLGGLAGGRSRRKLAPSTLNKIAAERKLNHMSTLRSNPFIDRTVLFNQFTSNAVQAASATILSNNMEIVRDQIVETPPPLTQQQLQQQQLLSQRRQQQLHQQQLQQQLHQQQLQQQLAEQSYMKQDPSVRFNLNRNELNLLNEEANKARNGLFRVSSASMNGKFDIVIPTGMLPSIKRKLRDAGVNHEASTRREERESVFERLNPKYVNRKKRNSLTKVSY